VKPNGIGAVRFGANKPRALAALRALLGAPSARGVNTGCGPRYTEVAWGDLVAEFRANAFSGYRYRKAGWSLCSGQRTFAPAEAALLRLSDAGA
jgi:hypothetical protein